MRTQGEHIRTLQRRVAFLKAREHRNSYDQAELGALEWALVNLPPAQQQQQPGRNHWEDGDVFERIAASKNQPAQQEPVAWMHTNAIGHVYFRKNPQDKTLNPVPLYTSPQPAQPSKPLTDEQIEREWQFLHDEEGNPPDHHDFARAIEAQLKEKNT